MGATVHIHGLIATAYQCVEIWIRIDQVQDVQHHLRDADPGNAAELQTSFCNQRLDYSGGLISVTAVQPVVELLYT